MSGDGYIRCVTLHLLWPLCGSKGNSALRELYLILGGSACVASGAVGREGMEDAGVRELKKSVFCGGRRRFMCQVSVTVGLVTAAGIQPQALLGALKTSTQGEDRWERRHTIRTHSCTHT